MVGPEPSTLGPRVVFTATAVGAVLLGLLWLAVSVGADAAGQSQPGNPIALPFELAMGKRAWPGGTSTLVLAGGLLLLAGVAAAIAVAVAKRVSRSTRADRAARVLAAGGELVGISPKDAARRAAFLRPGVELTTGDDLGVLLGETLRGRQQVRMGWEDVGVGIAGPRTGKSTTIGIPAIVGAPGAVVATSNKADLHDATRALREKLGRVWLFDPQSIVGLTAGAEWWVNLLSSVKSPAGARQLAGHFTAATTDAGARTDAYFDTEGRELLATYLLAAALGGGDLLHVAEWLANDTDRTPVRLLEEQGQTVAARQAMRYMELTPKQKDGLYGTARKLVAVLSEPAYAAWVTPASRIRFLVDGQRIVREPLPETRIRVPEFDPAAFVQSTGDTLYALSMEGPAAATALTTALVAQVFEAGERAASRMAPHRRLPTPLLFILDEAANVCRIRELPDLYSHFGSRGLPVLSILQSWSQGVEVWGESGMKKLWSASNVKWYGGGVSEAGFLNELSTLIGQRDLKRRSASGSRQGSSWSESWTKEPIYSPAELAALPRGRAILLSSGNEPTVLRLVPWMEGPHAEEIQESLRQWAPDGPAHSRTAATSEYQDRG